MFSFSLLVIIWRQGDWGVLKIFMDVICVSFLILIVGYLKLNSALPVILKLDYIHNALKIEKYLEGVTKL